MIFPFYHIAFLIFNSDSFFYISVDKLVYLKLRSLSSSLTLPITPYKAGGIFWARNECSSLLTAFLTRSFYVLRMLLTEISLLIFPDVISGPHAAAF